MDIIASPPPNSPLYVRSAGSHNHLAGSHDVGQSAAAASHHRNVHWTGSWGGRTDTPPRGSGVKLAPSKADSQASNRTINLILLGCSAAIAIARFQAVSTAVSLYHAVNDEDKRVDCVCSVFGTVAFIGCLSGFVYLILQP